MMVMSQFVNSIRYSVLFLLGTGLNICLFAQQQKTWQWVRQLGGDLWDISSGVVCDSKDNLYIAGSFLNSLKYSSLSFKSAGSRDIFISKFTKDGNLIRIITCGGKGTDIVTCLSLASENKVAVCGEYEDTASFGKIQVNNLGKNLFVGLLTNNDSFSWVTSISINGKGSIANVGADDQGFLYVAGTFSGSIITGNITRSSKGKRDIFLMRLTPGGTVDKLISMGSDEDDVLGSMSVSGSREIAISGVAGNTMKIGEKNVERIKGIKTTGFICELNKDFNPIWVKALNGKDYLNLTSLRFCKDGKLYAGGSFNSVFNTIDTSFISNGYTDGFILKYDSLGDHIWGRSFGSWYYDYANNINIDNSGGPIITGSIGDSLTIDSLNIKPKSRDNSSFILQFTPEGKAVWADYISGTGRNFSAGSTLDQSGNLYFTGSFINNFEKNDNSLTSFGDQDVFLTKYFNCLNSDAKIFGQTSFCPGTSTELSIKRGFTNIIWNDSIFDKRIISANIPGQYWVKMRDKKGCLLIDTVLVKEEDLPIFSLGNDTTISVYDSVLLKAPEKYLHYQWHDLTQETAFLAKDVEGMPGTKEYWLIVTDSSSCNFTDTIAITYIVKSKDLTHAKLIYYPNPARDKIYWLIRTECPSRLILELSDDNGRIFYHRIYDNYLPGEVKEINLQNLTSGHYNLKISDNNSARNFTTVPLIKQ